MPAKVLLDHLWSCCDLLTSKSNQFVFVPNCTVVVNFMNFMKLMNHISREPKKRTASAADRWQRHTKLLL